MFFPSFKSKIILFLLLLSTALTILAILLIAYLIPGIMRNEIFKSVRLERGSEQYENFVELPFPVSFKVYFFNVENPYDILNGQKPIVKEVGPYVYKEYRRKTLSETNDKNDTIAYTEREIFQFDQEASGNLLDTDLITTLNVLLIGTLQSAEKLGQTSLLSQCLKDIFPDLDTVFIKARVRDILFDGLRFCVRHLSLCEIQRTILCKVSESKKNVDKLEDGSLKFSFFSYKNNTDDGVFTINKGVKNARNLGQIVNMNNSTYTHFWERLQAKTECDQVNGTYSTVFPPQINKNDTFKVYSSDICRNFEIEFIKEDFYNNIKGYKFSPNNLTLRSKEENKEDCFCAKQTQNVEGEDSCFLNGVLDLQPCVGAPVLLSFPHFLWADQVYVESVDGVSPNEEIHRTFLLVEPDTGIPLQAKNRIQLNAVLRPITHIKQTKNLPRVVFPLIWIEEDVSLTDELIGKLNKTYFDKVKIVDIAKWVFLAVSSLLTLIFSTYFIWKRHSIKS